MNKSEIIQHAYVVTHILDGDELFPNNQKFPLLVYKGALLLHPDSTPETIKDIFAKNGWTNAWVDDVFDYHHYHSNTHEVLGVFCGKADLQLGGPEGVCVELTRGDVILIPAGVAHKKTQGSDDFTVVGAYPAGAEYDIKYGKDGERPAADETIAKVDVPECDPVYGKDAGTNQYWKQDT
ncbi:cupin domain-containing protein [Hufsiella ginkgonis]|uniref:Cupin type-1 domain-containing protein n=1 Tax=Hufsiella ginkgonis TaxID=2695274 RepID=A0A7K1Y4D3_9SPHI|nr:cupin domain-containing protein [Hufsiella ginkgonis]MXV17968.1 hypothetical protein [Hufsiella ginkgonis]